MNSPELTRFIVRVSSLPDYFVLKILFAKYLVEDSLQVVALFPIEVDIDAPIIRQEFLENNQSLSEELNELRAKNFVSVGFFLVLHEILARGERRIDIDKLDLAPRAEAVWPLLIGEQFA